MCGLTHFTAQPFNYCIGSPIRIKLLSVMLHLVISQNLSLFYSTSVSSHCMTHTHHNGLYLSRSWWFSPATKPKCLPQIALTDNSRHWIHQMIKWIIRRVQPKKKQNKTKQQQKQINNKQTNSVLLFQLVSYSDL